MTFSCRHVSNDACHRAPQILALVSFFSVVTCTTTHLPGAMDEDRMKRAFNLFDKDGDGKISQAELGEVLKTLNRSATDAEIKEMIGGSVSGMFTARGGAIDFETFKQMLVRFDSPSFSCISLLDALSPLLLAFGQHALFALVRSPISAERRPQGYG